jgi:hypothetical protein
VAAGGDHYFAEDEDINLKPIAMAKTIVVMVGRRELDWPLSLSALT